MARVFVLQGHANPNSYTQALGREFIRALKEAQHEVLEINAYQTDLPYADPSRLHFHGETTYAQMRDFIPQADALVFVFPVWWAGLPAAMKNVLDHFDFAFAMQEGKLLPKLKAQHGYVIRTCDAPAGWSKATANLAVQSLQEGLKACGVKRWGLYAVDGVGTSSLDQRKRDMGRLFTEGQKFARLLPK
ncbi:MAG TPA: NAD(P)H-dependent oxidoreductase [bacterium]|nr:NAD(P)H-dependent oxidoreductase [bacterium]